MTLHARIAAAICLALLAGPGTTGASASASGGSGSDPAALPPAETPAGSGPPAGRYACRQSLTTMGFLTIRPGDRYALAGVEGDYRYHADTGEVEWLSGSYHAWQWVAVYEHRSAADLERPEDEHIIRITDDTGGLRIDCFLTEP